MLATQRLRSTLAPIYTVMMVAGVIFILWLGGDRVITGLMTAGQLVAMLELYLQFVKRGFRVPQLINSVQAGGVAYRRLKPLLAPALSVTGEPPRASFRLGYVAGLHRDEQPAMAADGPAATQADRVGALASGAMNRAPTDAAPVGARFIAPESVSPETSAPEVSPPAINGHANGQANGHAPHREVRTGAARVDLVDVTFTYPGATRPAITDVSLTIPAGVMVGMTGAVGSGKSGLAKALVGVYQLQEGQILLDGTALTDLSTERRAAVIGYLPQDPWLFSGTIRENVVFGASVPDGPEADALVARAIRLAALEPDLAGFPLGLETPIGEGGVRVSGGQRQRISLARALLAGAPGRPGLLVLDDPFSAVDVDTEVRLVEGLLASVGPAAPPEERATIVLCSHRLAAFPRMDLVVVLDEGRVLEVGTHAELLAANGRYAHIYLAQQRIGQAGRLAQDPPSQLPPAPPSRLSQDSPARLRQGASR